MQMAESNDLFTQQGAIHEVHHKPEEESRKAVVQTINLFVQIQTTVSVTVLVIV